MPSICLWGRVGEDEMRARGPLESPGKQAGPGWVGVREAEPGPAFEVHFFSGAEVGHLRFQTGMELPDPQWGTGSG